jgi:hypothetical protein
VCDACADVCAPRAMQALSNDAPDEQLGEEIVAKMSAVPGIS